MGVRLTDFTYRGKSLVRDVFVETGTYQGETLQHAVDAGFKKLFSIEYVWEYALAAKEKFKGCKNVEIFRESSPDFLFLIVDHIKGTNLDRPVMSSLFWLDAHFQGGLTTEMSPVHGQCPLLAELAEIFRWPWKSKPPIVLIDDAHMFLKTVPTNFDSDQWPTFEEIKGRFPSGYTFSARIDKNKILIGDGGGMDNVIYCLPEKLWA